MTTHTGFNYENLCRCCAGGTGDYVCPFCEKNCSREFACGGLALLAKWNWFARTPATYDDTEAGLKRLAAVEKADRKRPRIEEGDELRATVEADLLLSAHWCARHGCNCGKHLE